MSLLIISAILFGLGAYGFMTRRNTINVLMCIEIMLGAANINLVYFSRFGAVPSMTSQVFAALVMAVAAAETAVGLALALSIFRRTRSVITDDVDVMRG